jgi:hypothetical protein
MPWAPPGRGQARTSRSMQGQLALFLIRYMHSLNDVLQKDVYASAQKGKFAAEMQVEVAVQ